MKLYSNSGGELYSGAGYFTVRRKDPNAKVSDALDIRAGRSGNYVYLSLEDIRALLLRMRDYFSPGDLRYIEEETRSLLFVILKTKMNGLKAATALNRIRDEARDSEVPWKGEPAGENPEFEEPLEETEPEYIVMNFLDGQGQMRTSRMVLDPLPPPPPPTAREELYERIRTEQAAIQAAGRNIRELQKQVEVIDATEDPDWA